MSIDSMTTKSAVSPHYGTQVNPFLSLGAPPNTPLDLPPGTTLGRFCIRRKLGQGSLGEVYHVHDTVNECDMAIKVATLGLLASTAPLTRLKREKHMYDRVRDKSHVLTVNDVFPIRYGGVELAVLSMELGDGGTLEDWLERYRRDWSARGTAGRAYIRQACLGLAALHEAGICHLDLKPSNFVFVGRTLKVADLGAAVLLAADDSFLASSRQPSWSDIEVGTACYRSPEHFTASPDDLDERSDIYSMGVLIYEVRSPKGRPPFQGDYDRLRELHTRVSAPALEGAVEAEARVVRRCLEKDPAKRYQKVRDLLDDLEGVLNHSEEKNTGMRAEELWADACVNLEQGWLDCARALCRRILRLAPDHEDAQEMLTQLDERFQQAGRIYETINSQRDSSGLLELVRLAIAAAELYPGHCDSCSTLIQLETKAEQYSVSMRSGLVASSCGDWDAARDWFAGARRHDASSVAAERAWRFSAGVLEQILESRRAIDVALRDGAFPHARRLADGLDEYLSARRNEAASLLQDLEGAQEQVVQDGRCSQLCRQDSPRDA